MPVFGVVEREGDDLRGRLGTGQEGRQVARGHGTNHTAHTAGADAAWFVSRRPDVVNGLGQLGDFDNGLCDTAQVPISEHDEARWARSQRHRLWGRTEAQVTA